MEVAKGPVKSPVKHNRDAFFCLCDKSLYMQTYILKEMARLGAGEQEVSRRDPGKGLAI